MRMVLHETNHVYQDLDDPDREYVSVSHVIRRLGLGKSWSGGIDPRRDRAVEFARERGKAVENVLYALLRGETPVVDVPAWTSDYNGGETLRESVERFLPGVYNWLDTNPEYVTDQDIVADPQAGIAGSRDLVTATHTIDVKATAKEEADWKLQVAAYESMDTTSERSLAVLHINPKLKGGYRWRPYDRHTCIRTWQRAREAWIRSREEFDRARSDIQEWLK